MKVQIIEQLPKSWEHRIWEGGSGGYVGSARFRLQTDEPIFASVSEENSRRLSRKGTPLYKTLDEVFYGRVGGHPFEITDVKSETEFTASFRIGYASHVPEEGEKDCENCSNKDDCDEYDGD